MEFDPKSSQYVLASYESVILGYPTTGSYHIPQSEADDLMTRIAAKTNGYREYQTALSMDGWRSENAYRNAEINLRLLEKMGNVAVDHAPSPADGAEEYLRLFRLD